MERDKEEKNFKCAAGGDFSKAAAAYFLYAFSSTIENSISLNIKLCDFFFSQNLHEMFLHSLRATRKLNTFEM